MIEGQDGDDFDRAAVRRKMAKQGYWYGATCTVIAAATVVAAVLAWSGASVFILLILTLPLRLCMDDVPRRKAVEERGRRLVAESL